METYLDPVVRYLCCGREAHVADTRVKQALYVRLYEQGLRSGQLYLTGSKYEGMRWAVCGDVDFMICERTIQK